MIQFIPEGPQIPKEVEQALKDDNLIFFCGAGISIHSNGLVSFEELVKEVCENLNINEEPFLKEAQEKENYDGMLALIEGNQSFSVSQETLRKEVIKILTTYKTESKKPNIDIHKSLLGLSALRSSEGHRLVTTNFDRLFFEAGLNPECSDRFPKLGQPKEKNWKNLTFLHGVIDGKKNPGGGDLVLTKTDFGKAYLKGKSATDFIVQLFQNFTVLFIGYSMSDPIMNYLISAINDENNNKKADRNIIKYSIYAFVEHKGNYLTGIEKNKWTASGIQPIPYRIKNGDNHSLLYDTVKKWADLKQGEIPVKKGWLKEQLKFPYKHSDEDKKKAETVIDFLEIYEKLANYFPQINFSYDPKKKKPVDISWLTPLAERDLLIKLTHKTACSESTGPWTLLWEPLPRVEQKIVSWLRCHLDKEVLIEWIINTGCVLHPDFKTDRFEIEDRENNIENNKINNLFLNKEKLFFWKIITSNSYPADSNRDHYDIMDTAINGLNTKYCEIKVQELLKCLEPYIGFDAIDKPILKTNIDSYSSEEQLTNPKALLSHAEDFSNLLKKAMDLGKLSGIIEDTHSNLSYRERYSIAPHSQNDKYYSWTYLIDLVRDSFDLAMTKDKSLAKFLLNKWQFYPYPIFYRLILYAVTKHSDLDEQIAIDLIKNGENNILWSAPFEYEISEYLKNRRHSEEAVKEIFTLIIQGPSRKKDIDDDTFRKHKEIEIYYRLSWLKLSECHFPKNIENYFNEIKKRYSLPTIEEDGNSDNFSREAHWVGSEKRYHKWTYKKIFNEIKYTQPHADPDVIDKRENFRFLVKDHPDKAFKVLYMFSDNDVKSAPYWSAFLSEISTIDDTEKSNKYFLKSLQKIENFSNEFFEKCLWALVYGLKFKAAFLYSQDKKYFKTWWDKLWLLSIKDKADSSLDALHSKLGQLSQSIFYVLWSVFSEKISKDGDIPEDIKNYFKVILQKGVKINPSVIFHFGSDLYALWSLDREWTMKNIKPLMNWSQNKNVCKIIWEGYSYRMQLDPDFLSDFKNEFFHLLLNSKNFYTKESKDIVRHREAIAELFFITTGGKWTVNIFTKKEIKELKKKLDIDILESLSRKIWVLLKDSGDKSANLWSEKVEPWVEQFWPKLINMRSSKIAYNLSLAILHCGDKLPDAFQFLKDKIEEIIINNHSYMIGYIERYETKLKAIFEHPKELICLLNLNFPDDKPMYSRHSEKIKKILDKLKDKNPEIEKCAEYKILNEKIS